MKALVATDGSSNSFEGVRQAGRILSPERDQLLLYYSPLGSLDAPGLDDHSAGRFEQFLSDAVFEQAVAHLPAGWKAKAEKIVGSGDPRAEILDIVGRQGVGLIVVGARGLGAIERLLLGSVSRSLAHAASVPVLVARANPARPPADPPQVLLACENLTAGRALAKAVSQFTWPIGTVGQLVSVVHTILPGKIPDWLLQRQRSPEVEEIISHWTKQQAAQLDQAREGLVEVAGLLPPTFQSIAPLVKEGQAEREILDAAKRQKSDLIVLGAKASTPVGRLLVGSTTDAVLNRAECSVLVVREHV